MLRRYQLPNSWTTLGGQTSGSLRLEIIDPDSKTLRCCHRLGRNACLMTVTREQLVGRYKVHMGDQAGQIADQILDGEDELEQDSKPVRDRIRGGGAVVRQEGLAVLTAELHQMGKEIIGARSDALRGILLGHVCEFLENARKVVVDSGGFFEGNQLDRITARFPMRREQQSPSIDAYQTTAAAIRAAFALAASHEELQGKVAVDTGSGDFELPPLRVGIAAATLSQGWVGLTSWGGGDAPPELLSIAGQNNSLVYTASGQISERATHEFLASRVECAFAAWDQELGNRNIDLRDKFRKRRFGNTTILVGVAGLPDDPTAQLRPHLKGWKDRNQLSFLTVPGIGYEDPGGGSFLLQQRTTLAYLSPQEGGLAS